MREKYRSAAALLPGRTERSKRSPVSSIEW
jgi:hypothetical protein